MLNTDAISQKKLISNEKAKTIYLITNDTSVPVIEISILVPSVKAVMEKKKNNPELATYNLRVNNPPVNYPA